jgi:hypothetical protein
MTYDTWSGGGKSEFSCERSAAITLGVSWDNGSTLLLIPIIVAPEQWVYSVKVE